MKTRAFGVLFALAIVMPATVFAQGVPRLTVGKNPLRPAVDSVQLFSSIWSLEKSSTTIPGLTTGQSFTFSSVRSSNNMELPDEVSEMTAVCAVRGTVKVVRKSFHPPVGLVLRSLR